MDSAYIDKEGAVLHGGAMAEFMAGERIKLLSSLISFTRYFYYIRTGRKFIISDPIARESHHIIICRELHLIIRGLNNRLLINIAPRYGKSELLIHFVAWALAAYPASKFMYLSYAHTLAARMTQTIREIVMLKEYGDLFGVHIRDDSAARDYFQTTMGGEVYAAGMGGTVTGMGAGIKGLEGGFGGAMIIDDAHKPDEAMSDVVREGANTWFDETASSRLNDPVKTPIIFLGQRVHERDLADKLIRRGGYKSVIIPALDDAGNALDPKMHSAEKLREMQEVTPYLFAGQYQQNPVPAGGILFKREWFPLREDEPEVMSTFLTVDTAETDKSYNDASVFAFWGVHRIEVKGTDIDLYGLYLLDLEELRVEPKDLEQALLDFYAKSLRYKKQPKFIAIEKKSTGVTLASCLKRLQGLSVMDVARTKASGSKAVRYLEMQEYAAKRLISLPREALYAERFVKHMERITANDTHAHDDICDVTYDAVKIALIDKVARLYMHQGFVHDKRIAGIVTSRFKDVKRIART